MTTARKGFTLIELMVVIAVIGILAAIALISLTGVQRTARDATRKSNISDYATALTRYYQDNQGYIATTGTVSAGNGTAGSGPFGTSGTGTLVGGGYLPKILTDPSQGQNFCGSGSQACDYEYTATAQQYNIWARLEAGSSGNNYYVIGSDGTRQNVSTEPTTPTSY